MDSSEAIFNRQSATESHMGRASSISQLDRHSLLQRLTAEGVRMTAQRRTVIEIIQESSDHLDAASLLRLAKARDGHIHRATVYRTLDLLKRMQIVDELDLMHLDGEKHFYEARVKSEHFHIACFSCGKIVEHNTLTFDQLKREVSEQTGFKIEVVRLEIGGRCQNCQSDNLDNPDGQPSFNGLEPGKAKDK